MKTQPKVDPLSQTEKNLVVGIFLCFILIIAIALLPDTLYLWISDLFQGANPPQTP